jgi:rhomboid family GlyGly-CTERM serine protease
VTNKFFDRIVARFSLRWWVYLAIAWMSFTQIFFINAIYDRHVLFIEPWRLWTAHWVHLGVWHFALNAVALALLPEIFLRTSRRFLILLWFVLPPLLSLLLYIFLPTLIQYAGLSGVLHGIYLATALNAIQSSHVAERRMGWLVALGLCLKVGWEAYSGNSQTAELIGAPVILQSHLYGASLGLLIWCMLRFMPFYKKICLKIKKRIAS